MSSSLLRMELLENWFRSIIWNAVSPHGPGDEMNVYIVHKMEEKPVYYFIFIFT